MHILYSNQARPYAMRIAISPLITADFSCVRNAYSRMRVLFTMADYGVGTGSDQQPRSLECVSQTVVIRPVNTTVSSLSSAPKTIVSDARKLTRVN